MEGQDRVEGVRDSIGEKVQVTIHCLLHMSKL